VFGLLSFVKAGGGVAVFELPQLVYLPKFYLVASIMIMIMVFMSI
jgi:hypothetical protein